MTPPSSRGIQTREPGKRHSRTAPPRSDEGEAELLGDRPLALVARRGPAGGRRGARLHPRLTEAAPFASGVCQARVFECRARREVSWRWMSMVYGPASSW